MLKLITSIIICQLAGVIGSFFTVDAITQWYVFLNKPSFNPPNWVFAPVWTILYTLMGVAAYLLWRKGLKTAGIKRALEIFLLQLALNSLWSVVFFGLCSILGGFVVIVLLWLAIFWTIIKFYSIEKSAALLLIPYILWVSFALVLNAALLILN